MPYAPASRRPIADLFRATAHAPVRLCVRWSIHPDTVSYLSIAASAAAAVAFWQSGRYPLLLIPAVLLCYVRLWFNMLDGMVALASGKASLKGELVNELPDRLSDILIFVGLAHSGLCTTAAGYGAAIAALMTAYVGTLGQAVAGRREFGGIMSKPWRMVVLHAGAWTTLALGADTRWLGLSVLDWTCAAIVAGSLQTIAVRLSSTLKLLKGRAA